MKKALTPLQKAKEFRPSTTREELAHRIALDNANAGLFREQQAADREAALDVGDYERIGPGRIRDAGAALSFILAGCALFTLRSQRTGVRYTYRVSKAKPDYNRPGQGDCWFVSLLTGPENESDYSYLGIIRDNVFRLTGKSRMKLDSGPVKAFAWTFAKLTTRTFPEQLEIWHEGHCGRCGRTLTVPESIERGIGPECAAQMGVL